MVGEAGFAGPGVSLTVLLVAATVVVVWVLGAFLFGERYLKPEEVLGRAEFEELRRRAEARMSVLAPGAILLSEKERAAGSAAERVVEAEEFWRRFGGASALVEEDPAAALRELRGLPALLERALAEADGKTGCGSVREAEEDER